MGQVGGNASAAAAVAALYDNSVASSEPSGESRGSLGSWVAVAEGSADGRAGGTAGNEAEEFGDESWVDVNDEFASPAQALPLSGALSPLASAAASSTPSTAQSSLTSPQPSDLLSPQSLSSASLLLMDMADVVWQGRVVNVSVVGDAPGTLFLSRQKMWFSPDDKEKPLGFWDRGRCSWCAPHCFCVQSCS